MISSFNAIIFDLGGVILNIDYHKTSQAFKSLGISNFDELYSQAKQNHIFDDLEKGLIEPKVFYDYVRSASQLGLTDDQIENAWNAMLLELPVHRIKLLQDIGKKYPIYLFSNTNEIHLNAFRQIIGRQHGNSDLLEDLFIETYYSHEINMRKPDANGFLKIIEDNQLDIATTLFIDDSEQHIIGANSIGLQTHWLNSGDISDLF